MNSFVNDVFERFANESSKLSQHNSRSKISSREVQTLVRLLFPGELAKHADSEGTKDVTKYTSCKFSLSRKPQAFFKAIKISLISIFYNLLNKWIRNKVRKAIKTQCSHYYIKQGVLEDVRFEIKYQILVQYYLQFNISSSN